jgi:hypothetical protein
VCTFTSRNVTVFVKISETFQQVFPSYSYITKQVNNNTLYAPFLHVNAVGELRKLSINNSPFCFRVNDCRSLGSVSHTRTLTRKRLGRETVR